MAATATTPKAAKATNGTAKKATAPTNGAKANGNGKTPMSDQHKAALAQGRKESAVVSSYLEALTEHRPKRGRKRTVESIDARLATIEAQLDNASAIDRLNMIQERSDLADERARLADTPDLTSIEDEFVKVAASYSVRKGIGYSTWRAMGVDADVLVKAGIKRSAK